MGGAIVLLAASPGLHAAQPIVMTPPPPPTTPVWSQEEATNNEMQVFLPSGQMRTPGDQPFQYGPVTFRPHAYYAFSYGNGIEYSTNHTASTIIQTVTPGLSVDIGRHLTLDYTPTLTYYSSSQLQNTLGQSATLNWATAYEDWLFGLNQAWNLSTAPQSQTATSTKTEDFSTGASASYIINDHFSTDLGFNQDLNYVQNLQDSKTWSTMDWLNYSFWRRLSTGVGAGYGYTSLSPDNGSAATSGIQTFETLLGRVNWRASDKISFSVNAGFEDRQFHAKGISDSLNPIFSASIQYQPFAHTQLALTASRSVSSSDYFILTQSTETTTVGVSLDQRLFKEFYLDVSGTYSKTVYNESIVVAAVTRDDDQYTFNVALRHSFLKHGSVSVNYQYQDNESTTTGFSYTSNQIGFQIGYTY